LVHFFIFNIWFNDCDFTFSGSTSETNLINRKGIEEGVSPFRWHVEDVATPFEGELCECHDVNGDAYWDLSLKFNIIEIVEKLALAEVIGETIRLNITGNLKEEEDGTPFKGQDCMTLLWTAE